MLIHFVSHLRIKYHSLIRVLIAANLYSNFMKIEKNFFWFIFWQNHEIFNPFKILENHVKFLLARF